MGTMSMKIALEKERKFLIKLPLSQEAKEIVIDNADAPANIVQTYIRVAEGISERVRMVSVEMWGRNMCPHYYHTIKKFVSHGINEEAEESISQHDYIKLLMKADPSFTDIEKTRYYVSWAGELFELDIFRGKYEGLAILEIELTDIDSSVELPPFLEVIREVTSEKEYSNASLAVKKN